MSQENVIWIKCRDSSKTRSDHLSDPNQRRSVRKQWRNRAENHAKGLQNGRKTSKNGYRKARGLFGTTMPHVRTVSLRPKNAGIGQYFTWYRHFLSIRSGFFYGDFFFDLSNHGSEFLLAFFLCLSINIETHSFAVRQSRRKTSLKQRIFQRRNAFSPGLAVRSFARFEKRPFGVVYSFEGYAVNGRTIEPIIPRISLSE